MRAHRASVAAKGLIGRTEVVGVGSKHENAVGNVLHVVPTAGVE